MDVIEGMARALFVTAWADYQETINGQSFSGCELMDVAPETHELARFAAYRLCGMTEQANGLNIHAIVAAAKRSDGYGDVDGESDKTLDTYESDFGHYLAMQAMGHGVAWTDDHAEVRFHGVRNGIMTDWPMVTPHFEFNYMDLAFDEDYEDKD